MKKGWESPACNLCGNSNLKVWLTGVTTWEHRGRFTYSKCPRCQLVFQSPRPPFRQAVKYYPSSTYWGRNIKKLIPIPNLIGERWKTYGQIYRWVQQEKLPPGKILDIGSGLGLFLSQFGQWGWKMFGTDISKDVANYSHQVFGIKTKVGDINVLSFPKNYFDVISMISVLEHIYNPNKTLSTVYRLLRKHGYLIIFVPNVDGLGRYIFSKNWVQLQPARHLYLFSPDTVTQLLNKTGFKVIKIDNWSWEHNFYSFYQSLRMAFSKKLKAKRSGGIASGRLQNAQVKSPFSIQLEMGKLLAWVAAATLTVLGSILGRGEMMTIYAKKT